MTSLTRKKLLLSVAVLALSGLAGCATTPAPANLADLALRKPELSTLNKLLVTSGLADTLRGPGPFTIFAPSDDAFKTLPAKTLAELSADKELLKGVLSYHVLPAKLMAAEVKNSNVKTVQGANLALATAGSFVTVEDAVVTQPDVAATNGVLHVIDKVLLPPKR